MTRSKKFYAVVRGRRPGIYTQWFGPDGAQVQVAGFPNARYKGFPSRCEAEAFMKNGGVVPASAQRKGKTAAPQDPPAPANGPRVEVYTDGGALGNPGPGGWGVRLKYSDGRIIELGGAEVHTTNNRMELTAAIEGLKRVSHCGSITVVTDSEYLRKGITQWIHGWKRRGWMTAARKPVLNQDLWQALDRLNRPDIQWRYTRGHAGDPDNERCDELARAEAERQKEFAHG